MVGFFQDSQSHVTWFNHNRNCDQSSTNVRWYMGRRNTSFAMFDYVCIWVWNLHWNGIQKIDSYLKANSADLSRSTTSQTLPNASESWHKRVDMSLDVLFCFSAAYRLFAIIFPSRFNEKLNEWKCPDNWAMQICLHRQRHQKIPASCVYFPSIWTFHCFMANFENGMYHSDNRDALFYVEICGRKSACWI